MSSCRATNAKERAAAEADAEAAVDRLVAEFGAKDAGRVMELADAVRNTMLGVCRDLIAKGVPSPHAVRLVIGGVREGLRVLEAAQKLADRRVGS